VKYHQELAEEGHRKVDGGGFPERSNRQRTQHARLVRLKGREKKSGDLERESDTDRMADENDGKIGKKKNKQG